MRLFIYLMCVCVCAENGGFWSEMGGSDDSQVPHVMLSVGLFLLAWQLSGVGLRCHCCRQLVPLTPSYVMY